MATLDISFHRGQLEIFGQRDKKVRVAVCARRFGKTSQVIQESVLSSLTFPGTVSQTSPEAVLIALPTLQQAIPLIWEPLLTKCENDLAPYVARIDRQRFNIHFKNGKPSIRVRGANDRDGDGLRGMRLYKFFGDEYQDFHPEILDTIILPAMADTQGSTALLTLTPKGRQNHAYKVFQRAKTDPDNYISFQFPTEANPFVPREEIERFRRSLVPRVFRQEFEAAFEAFPSRVFYELDDDNRCDEAPRVTYAVMGCDWGSVNPAVSVWGMAGGSWYHLESWKNDTGSAVPLDHQEKHVVRLGKKYPVRAVLCDPSQPSMILRLRELGERHGLEGLQKAVAGYNPIAEGLGQMHSLIYQRKMKFPRLDDPEQYQGRVSSEELFSMFESYSWAVDRYGVVQDGTPEDGQDDHLIDCTRYLISRKK